MSKAPKIGIGLSLAFVVPACNVATSAESESHLAAAALGPILVLQEAGVAVRSEDGGVEYIGEDGSVLKDVIKGSGEYHPGLQPELELAKAAYSCSPLVWIDRSFSHTVWIMLPAAASQTYAEMQPVSDAEFVNCIKRETGASFRVGRVESPEQLPAVEFLSEEQLNAQTH